MSVLTAAEKTLLRTQPQSTRLWLSIYQPTTILSAQVNDVFIVPGAYQITYDNSSGSYTKIKSGMTMLVGTTPGGKDIGKIRVRSATSTVITVAENYHIKWANDLYLTVLNFWEIEAVYPRIIDSGGGNLIWYKDYDIAYTNQNDNLGSFICMGSHFAGFLESGNCPVYYSATGTVNLGGESLTYYWDFPGADTITGSNSLTPGWINYKTAGHYTTSLIVSGTSSGVSDVSYRHVSIYDRPEVGTNNPILQWELTSMDGSRDSGGYKARAKIWSQTTNVVDGALVVMFADDWYGSTKQSIGGNSLNRSSIVFSGYIIDGSITYNYNDRSVEFQIGSPTEIMKIAEGFSVATNSSTNPSLQVTHDKDIPSAWALIKDMNCKKAIYHFLRWHSTVLFTSDFQFMGTDYPIQYFDADRTSLYDGVQSFMNGTLVGQTVSDRQGKIWAEISPGATDLPTSVFLTNWTLDKQDWMGNPTIDEAPNENISYLEYGGVAYSGVSTGTSTALMACAPGGAPAYRGTVERNQGLALGSQVQLNALVGNVFAYDNARFPHADFQLVGNYRNFDIAPIEITNVILTPADNVRGLNWLGKAFHIISMSWTYNGESASFIPSIQLHEITQGYPGQTIPIPPIPPNDGNGTPIPTITPGGYIVISFPKVFNWSYVMGDGSGAIPTGLAGWIEVPTNCNIASVKVVAHATGSIVIDLWKCAYASIDNSSHPVVGDSIIGAGAKPTLSSGYKTSTNLTGWTTLALMAGDWLYINIESCDLSLVTLSISGVEV